LLRGRQPGSGVQVPGEQVMATLDESDLPEAALSPVPLRRGPNLAALGTLFRLTLRQHVRGRRLLVLAAIFLLPTVVAVLARSVTPPSERAPLLFNLIFTLIPHALVPLMALLYAAGMIRDEVEDQTLTY